MQSTSQLYKDILQGSHWFETSVVVGDASRLVDKDSGLILFGGDSILTDAGGPESGFKDDQLFAVQTEGEFFKDREPGVGAALSGEVDITMVAPYNVPKRSSIRIFTRAVNAISASEWVPQGVYYIDTRQQTCSDRGFDVLNIHGYDSMRLADITYPSDSAHDYPLLDRTMVQFIADNMKIDSKGRGISVDPRTWNIMQAGYKFPLPVGYSMREVLCMIAAAYAGNYIITQIEATMSQRKPFIFNFYKFFCQKSIDYFLFPNFEFFGKYFFILSFNLKVPPS